MQKNPAFFDRFCSTRHIGTGACVRACAYALRTAPLPPIYALHCRSAPQGYHLLGEKSSHSHKASITLSLSLPFKLE